MQKTILINQQLIKLSIVTQKGTCFHCQLTKEIRLISYQQIWIGTAESYCPKKYCWACTLNSLYLLEQGNYELENKEQLIKELRTELNK